MTLREKLDNIAIQGDLFPSLTPAEKNINKLVVTLAHRIRKEREKLSLNQKNFADLMTVSQGMVSKWESGEYNFSLESAVSIFQKLGLNLTFEFSPIKTGEAVNEGQRLEVNQNWSLACGETHNSYNGNELAKAG